MSQEHTPKKKLSNYLDESKLQSKQKLKKPEKSESYRWGSLPLWTSLRSNNTQDNFKRYKREVTKYRRDEWTVAEEINKSFIPKLKQYTVDTTQVVNAHYKGAEISRLHGRATTEIYEQLSIIQAGEISTEEAHQLLDEAIESAKRLAVHAWIQGRQHDEDAKDYAIRALKLPASLKHLETKEPGSKREAFSEEFITMYNEANYQQRVLRAATTKTSNGRGRGGYSTQSNWNNNRGGHGYFGRGGAKNYFGGRGRRTPTFHTNNFSHNSHSATSPDLTAPDLTAPRPSSQQ